MTVTSALATQRADDGFALSGRKGRGIRVGNFALRCNEVL